MTLGAGEAAGLAELACALGRDLQRAARAAGGPGPLWRAGGAGLADALRLTGAAAAEARAARDGIDAESSLRAVCALGLTIIPLGDPAYPPRLAEVFDPPFALIARGWEAIAAGLAERPVIAVVGARRATPPARRFARSLSAELAERGAVVVSGLALGIDAEAHAGALEGGGPTLAVLGCGALAGYPRANAALRVRIEANGAVCGEYWPHTPPAPWRFPARNRIVSGLSHAVVVVEAAGRSGALITADFALEQGRPVLAVPGWPWSEAAVGCNELIRAGAAVCTGAADVIAEVPHPGWRSGSAGSPGGPALEGMPRDVHELLRGSPMRADELAAALGADPAAVAAALAFLEMEGLALRGDGQRWWAAPSAA